MTADGGRSWEVISPDLTTNDKNKQIIPPGLFPETQDVPCTLIAIAESPIEPGVIWTGSNDGVVSVTRNGGKSWANVTANIPALRPWGFVNSVEPSRHAMGTAYVTVDRHRAADNATYVFKTDDYGRTWKAIGGSIPASVFSYARVVREDPRRKGMLYLGTENALYVSVDDGAGWLPLQNNLPHAPIAWMTVQEDFNDLVVATWGRGIWILDDVTPLQQLTPAVLGQRAHLFDPRPAYLLALRPPTTTESFASEFDPPSNSGRNPPYGASLSYYLGAPATGDVRLTILDERGATVNTLTAAGNAGINRIWWNLRAAAPAVSAAGAAGARGGGAGLAPGAGGGGGRGRGGAAPLVTPGIYTVRLSVGSQLLETKLSVRRDPNAPM
jgi:hypothetical protein